MQKLSHIRIIPLDTRCPLLPITKYIKHRVNIILYTVITFALIKSKFLQGQSLGKFKNILGPKQHYISLFDFKNYYTRTKKIKLEPSYDWYIYICSILDAQVESKFATFVCVHIFSKW